MNLKILIDLIESAFNCTLQQFTYLVLICYIVIVPFCKWAYNKLVREVFKK